MIWAVYEIYVTLEQLEQLEQNQKNSFNLAYEMWIRGNSTKNLFYLYQISNYEMLL